MRRDPDLVRLLLLQIEANHVKGLIGSEIDIEGYDRSVVMSHLNMLADAGYLVAEYTRSKTNPDRIIATAVVFDLSWKGHEYLDTARNSERWKRTREIANKAGARSFEFLLEIANGLARAEPAKITGLAV